MVAVRLPRERCGRKALLPEELERGRRTRRLPRRQFIRLKFLTFLKITTQMDHITQLDHITTQLDHKK